MANTTAEKTPISLANLARNNERMKEYIQSEIDKIPNSTVDDTLSDTSTNPVQGNVIKQAIDNKADKIVATTDTDGLMSAEDKTKLDSADDTYALKSKYGDTTINVGRKAGTTVGTNSTAEGIGATASGVASHAEGTNTIASGNESHAGGLGSESIGYVSFAHGHHTLTNNDYEIAFGRCNVSNSDTLFSIGDSPNVKERHNAFEITTDSGKLHDKYIATMDDIPTSLPASDVKAWAKADTKPTYTASEVGADASGSANTALTNAKSYTDTKIADLINGAPSTLDTLGEIATAMEENQTVVEALNSAIGTKANSADLTSHINDTSNPHGVTKSQVGLGNVPNVATNDQTPSYTEATSLTKLSSGEKLSVAFGKISKAITDLISHIGDSVKHITSTERTNWNAAKTHADSAHAPSNAQANVIETVKVNGTALTPSSKAVNITVPSVGNGTITITQNGTTKGTFTTNQSGNTTIALTDNNTTYSEATTSAAGLLSASDKSKLDGISSSADAVSVSQSLTSGTKVGTITINGTNTILYAPTNTDTHWTTGLKVGASSTATANAAATNGNVYLNVLDNTTVRDSHKIVGSGATTVTSDANGNIVISSTDNNTTYSAATQSANGLMSAADKKKLDGIATGATANIGTITGIKMNGASKGTSGVVDLGTVLTAHQSLSGYVPTSRTVNGKALSSNISLTASDIGAAASSHTHSYVPLSGGTMTGALVAQSNTSYTTAQVRNATMSTSAPSGGSNGQIHYQYS